jgi:hypothetical protein
MNWRPALTTLAAIAFLGFGILADLDRIAHARDPQPAWIVYGGIELALLILLPSVYHAVHALKRSVRRWVSIQRRPVTFGVLVFCGMMLLGAVDHYKLLPPVSARLSLIGFGASWLSILSFGSLMFSMLPNVDVTRRRIGLMSGVALIAVQSATAVTALLQAGFSLDAWYMGIISAFVVAYVVLAFLAPARDTVPAERGHQRALTRVRTAAD